MSLQNFSALSKLYKRVNYADLQVLKISFETLDNEIDLW